MIPVAMTSCNVISNTKIAQIILVLVSTKTRCVKMNAEN